MNVSSATPTRILLATALVALACCALLGIGSALAQSTDDVQTMTPDELEAHIAEQKAKLADVIENRDITERKAAEIEAELAEREAKQAEVEAEMRDLCETQNEIEPGTLEACLAQLES